MVPDWLWQERAGQRDMMRLLRARRRVEAEALAEQHFGVVLAGAGPWSWPTVYTAWRALARRLPDAGAWRERWFAARLVAAGYRVEGRLVALRERTRDKWGSLKWRTTGYRDDRVIARIP